MIGEETAGAEEEIKGTIQTEKETVEMEIGRIGPEGIVKVERGLNEEADGMSANVAGHEVILNEGQGTDDRACGMMMVEDPSAVLEGNENDMMIGRESDPIPEIKEERNGKDAMILLPNEWIACNSIIL